MSATACRFVSIKVFGGYLDGFHATFTPGLNCIIGERGTAKSTLVEFLRFALDQAPDGEDKQTREARRRFDSIIKTNLQGGRVELEIETEGRRYTIRRSWGEDPSLWTADNKPVDVSLKVSALFRAVIYSQNEVEEIADRDGSQIELIDRFRAEEFAKFDVQIRQTLAALKQNSLDAGPEQLALASLEEELSEKPLVVEKLRAYGVGDDAGVQVDEAHRKKSLRDLEQRAVAWADEQLGNVTESLQTLVGQAEQSTMLLKNKEFKESPNQDALAEMNHQLSQFAREIDRELAKLEKRFARQREQLAEQTTKLRHAHQKQNLEFQQFLEKHEQAQKEAAERSELNVKLNALEAKSRQQAEHQQKLAALQEKRAELLAQLSDLRDQRSALREEIAATINEQLGSSGPIIEVEIKRFGDREEYIRELSDLLKKAGVNANQTAEQLAAEIGPAELVRIVAERDVPRLVKRTRFERSRAEKVIVHLATKDLGKLETIELADKAHIRLRDGKKLKELEKLSTGQKCTCVLPIALLDSRVPACFDQPEDNLDNKFVYEIIRDTVLKVKQERQVLCVTHVANLPILGEADNVLVMGSDGSRAWKEIQGDVNTCTERILSLLEGGKPSFTARHAQYLSQGHL